MAFGTTPYNRIYDRFINKITDYDLLGLETENIMELCFKYLKSAISKFADCKADLSHRDDAQLCFLNELSEIEEEILSHLMVVEWLSPKILNITNLHQYLGDNDYKGFSQANHLKELQELKNNSQDEVERLTTRYTWSTKEDIKGLI